MRRLILTTIYLIIFLIMMSGKTVNLPVIQPLVVAQASQPNLMNQNDNKPLIELLNSDGTLDLTRGYNGRLNPAGWRMEYGVNNTPIFNTVTSPAAPNSTTKTWYPLDPGLNGGVFDIAASGSDLYVGGAFVSAGGFMSDADKIARWDGSNWNELGVGLNGNVDAVAVSESNVYVGGSFMDAGGVEKADRIARWDSSTWHPLSPGLDQQVYAIVLSGPDVYVGGYFEDAVGNPNADKVARWDGSRWHALFPAPNHNVFALEVSGSDVYVGGYFTDAGGNPKADRIARWGEAVPLFIPLVIRVD